MERKSKFGSNQFLLVAIASMLVALHLHLVWHSENTDLMGSSILYWAAVGYLVWERRKDYIHAESDLVSTGVGALAIAFVLYRSLSLVGNDLFLRLFPAIAAIGLSLLFSGFNRLGQHSRELFLLFLFAIPPGLLSLFVKLSPLTAQFATFVLWCLGFDVTRQGVFISLPTGSIEVYAGCSGTALILQIVGLAAIFLMLFPTKLYQKVLVSGVAVTLAFCVNGLRVALMTLLVAMNQKELFDYWHLGDGSLIFSTVAVLLFGLFCFSFVDRMESSNSL
ncbi:cyanoexosortase A [Tumidithrix elongata RA019]|uniref:Cyanoexosortase A n=1 Tax=Tumidithrix elongata BACA0141 TaxID=2716417 RepID=A0AAW9PX62_9CYAN|nr:cyanoexosortase A [Tumidithrix elongata RA019]